MNKKFIKSNKQQATYCFQKPSALKLRLRHNLGRLLLTCSSVMPASTVDGRRFLIKGNLEQIIIATEAIKYRAAAENSG